MVLRPTYTDHLLRRFTYFRFWYLSLVACRRNPGTCEWEHVSDFDSEISYDLYLVNGNPEGRNKNIFEFQYSYDNQVSKIDIFDHLLCSISLFFLAEKLLP